MKKIEEQIEKIKKILKDEKIKNIYLNFVDISGNIFTKMVGVDELIRNTHVSWFDGISLNGSLINSLSSEAESDWLVLLPDPYSFRVLTFLKDEKQKAGMIFCDIKNHTYNTRGMLKNAVQEFLDMGITPIKENISSCPVHMSLWKGKHEKNLFFDENDKYELSDIGKKFINGILKNKDETDLRNRLQEKIKEVPEDDKNNLKIEIFRADHSDSNTDILQECKAEKFMNITYDGKLGGCPWLMKSDKTLEVGSLLEEDFSVLEEKCKSKIMRKKEKRREKMKFCNQCSQNDQCGKECMALQITQDGIYYGLDPICPSITLETCPSATN